MGFQRGRASIPFGRERVQTPFANRLDCLLGQLDLTPPKIRAAHPNMSSGSTVHHLEGQLLVLGLFAQVVFTEKNPPDPCRNSLSCSRGAAASRFGHGRVATTGGRRLRPWANVRFICTPALGCSIRVSIDRAFDYFGLIPSSFCASFRIDRSAISLSGISRSTLAVFFASSMISRSPASGGAPSSLKTRTALS
jgi:hypothetical protein